jgi:hypothetical protein
MNRIVPLLFVLALATGCKRDNASPFTHGAANAPNSGGTAKVDTSATAPSTAGAQSTATEYGGSTATSGGAAPAQDHPTTTGSNSGGQAQ